MKTSSPAPIDIAALFPALTPLAKLAIRLHPRAGNEPGLGESKMGGSFLWPSNEPWPICTDPEESLESENSRQFSTVYAGDLHHNDFYIGVLQLCAQDLPKIAFPSGKDLFQLLWCPWFHLTEDTNPLPCKVVWRNSTDLKQPLDPIPTPAYPEERYQPLPCILSPEQVLEYPGPYDLPEELWDTITAWEGDDEDSIYDEELSVAPGTKIGGYPLWIQGDNTPGCSCGRIMEHLLTVSTEEFYSGTFNRWYPLEERILAKADPKIMYPTGLMLGDAGSIYGFICRQCEDWPTRWIFQTS